MFLALALQKSYKLLSEFPLRLLTDEDEPGDVGPYCQEGEWPLHVWSWDGDTLRRFWFGAAQWNVAMVTMFLVRQRKTECKVNLNIF
jgi:hypothetical protein